MIRQILANFQLVKCCLLYFSRVNNYNQMKAGSLFYLPGKNYRWPVKTVPLREFPVSSLWRISHLTLFRLGFFGQSVTGGGLLGPPPSVSLEPIMLGSWNLHTMIISIPRSPTPSFDLPRPMMTSQWRHIPSFQCFLLFFHFNTQNINNIGKVIFFAILSYELVTRKHLYSEKKQLKAIEI